MVGVPTGLPGLDELLGGLVPGRMIVLGARPSVGKTALALSMARHALGHDVPVLIFSAEMSSAELGFRLLVSETGISAQRYQSQAVEDQEWEGTVAPAALRLRPLPLLVDDSGGLTMTDVSVRARRWRQDHRGGGGLIVIDYLQLLEQRGRFENRQTEVSAISRAVKVLAKDLDVPVLALSQLNRSPDARADRKPMLSDLRESGSLEQDADQVILEHEPVEADREGELDLIVVKNRHGGTGTVTVAYNRVLGRFTEL
jgi:replicative DNA helicase